MAGNSFPVQIISDNGEFDEAAMQRFSNAAGLNNNGGIPYVVVAIMGPQSSGKSTLFNYLFGTSFSVMGESPGRTTMGIWIAKAEGIEPLTLVMDVEGADSQERADQEDATFEKQSAMFAVAAADILLINIWCKDIGRNGAAGRPLLGAVLKGMMRMPHPRKTTLLYVIRDKTKTPFTYLKNKLRENIQNIWETLPKKPAYRDTPLGEFFNVQVIALSSYEYAEETFKAEVLQLRQRFIHSTLPGGLASCNREVDAQLSAFCTNINLMWETIKQDKNLDLPPQRILEDKLRCEEIGNQKFNSLASDKDWLALEQAVNADAGAILGFGTSATTVLNKYLSEYDAESQLFDEQVRNDKRQNIKSKALTEVMYPCYKKMLRFQSSISFESFKIQLEDKLGRGETGFAATVWGCQMSCIDDFNWRCSDAIVEQANWDVSKLRAQLKRDIQDHALVVRASKLSKLVDEKQKNLREAVVKPVEFLFETGGSYTWASIRDLLKRESDKAGLELSSAIAGFALEPETVDKMVGDLKLYATNLVKKTSTERAHHALLYLKEKFSYATMYDEDRMPRDQENQNKQEILNYAHHECLKLLATMAVIRLEDRTDSVEDLLRSSLMPAGTSRDGSSGDPLASNTWDQEDNKGGKKRRNYWKYLSLVVRLGVGLAMLDGPGILENVGELGMAIHEGVEYLRANYQDS